jgi:hypothetical protein
VFPHSLFCQGKNRLITVTYFLSLNVSESSYLHFSSVNFFSVLYISSFTACINFPFLHTQFPASLCPVHRLLFCDLFSHRYSCRILFCRKFHNPLPHLNSFNIALHCAVVNNHESIRHCSHIIVYTVVNCYSSYEVKQRMY